MAEYRAKRFNVGDKVFVTRPHLDDKDYEEGHVYNIKGKSTNGCEDKCYILAGLGDPWFDDELEIAEFKEGDVVKLNPDAKIGDFPRDEATGAVLRLHKGTTTALEGFISLRFDEEYTVVGKEGTCNTLLRLRESYDSCLSDYLFDACLFTLVRRPEEIKEVTIEDLEKQLGYKIKIVKENNENESI